MKPILVIGSLNMDLSLQMEQLPKAGETVLGNSILYIPGGKGANQACAAARLGGQTAMLGVVGQDSFGQALLENLHRAGVDTRGLEHRGEVTGMAVIQVDRRGENNIVVLPGANAHCTADYLQRHTQSLAHCGFVLLQMEIPQEACFYAVRKAKALGKTVLLNPAPAPESLPRDLLPLVDFLTPNETELARLSGLPCGSLPECKAAAQKLLELGTGAVLVTLGGAGALLVQPGQCLHFPAEKIQPVDTTAAGDCFNAAFTVALAEGMPLADAVPFANCAAGISVTRKGAQSSLPTRQEVADRLSLSHIPAPAEI